MTYREQLIKTQMGKLYHLPKVGLVLVLIEISSLIAWIWISGMWIPAALSVVAMLFTIAAYVFDRIAAEGVADRIIEGKNNSDGIFETKISGTQPGENTVMGKLDMNQDFSYIKAKERAEVTINRSH